MANLGGRCPLLRGRAGQGKLRGSRRRASGRLRGLRRRVDTAGGAEGAEGAEGVEGRKEGAEGTGKAWRSMHEGGGGSQGENVRKALDAERCTPNP